MTWDQILAMNAPMITVVVGLFVWLRADIKRLEDKMAKEIGDVKAEIKALDLKVSKEIRRLDERWDRNFKRLEEKFDSKLESEIRRLESRWDADIKRLEEKFDSKLTSEIRRLENRWDTDLTRLKEMMEAGFVELEARLRGVETEQARVASLLEGLALTGRLPEPS